MHKWLTAVIIIFIGIWIWSLVSITKRQAKCTELSGVYIQGQCFKAELIKIND